MSLIIKTIIICLIIALPFVASWYLQQNPITFERNVSEYSFVYSPFAGYETNKAAERQKFKLAGLYLFNSKTEESSKILKEDVPQFKLSYEEISPDGFKFTDVSETEFKLAPGNDKIGVQYLEKDNKRTKLRLTTFDGNYEHVSFVAWLLK